MLLAHFYFHVRVIIPLSYLEWCPVSLWVNSDIEICQLGLCHSFNKRLKAKQISLHICHRVVLIWYHTVGHVTQSKVEYWRLVHLPFWRITTYKVLIRKNDSQNLWNKKYIFSIITMLQMVIFSFISFRIILEEKLWIVVII